MRVRQIFRTGGSGNRTKTEGSATPQITIAKITSGVNTGRASTKMTTRAIEPVIHRMAQIGDSMGIIRTETLIRSDIQTGSTIGSLKTFKTTHPPATKIHMMDMPRVKTGTQTRKWIEVGIMDTARHPTGARKDITKTGATTTETGGIETTNGATTTAIGGIAHAMRYHPGLATKMLKADGVKTCTKTMALTVALDQKDIDDLMSVSETTSTTGLVMIRISTRLMWK